MTPHKPRILFLAPFPPPVHGAGIVCKQIMESKLINDSFQCDYVNISTSRKMEEIGRFQVAKIFHFIRSLSTVLKKLICNRYDLCYLSITCHGPGFLKDAPFAILCKLFKCRIVIHQQNMGMLGDVKRPVYRLLYKSVYKNSKVILLSWHLFPDIEAIVNREDVMICPNGIKPDNYLIPIHKQDKILHILFLSNLLIDKGVLVLLDALKILTDKGYKLICDFVGSETVDISSQRFMEETKMRGLEKIAIYHGRKYGMEKSYFFGIADIFTLPSFNDAFPLVIIEAMEHGIPIVATDVGGIPDEVQDGRNGFLVPCRNTEALADSLEKLLNDSSMRQAMGKKGYSYFTEKFTEEIFEKRMCQIFNYCIN